MKKKVFSLLLTGMLALSGTVSAFACTGTIIGKNVSEDGTRLIAKMAKEKKVGARALRAIIEEFMLDIMYEIPKDDNIGMVTITKEYVEKTGGPRITMRGCMGIGEKSVERVGMA